MSDVMYKKKHFLTDQFLHTGDKYFPASLHFYTQIFQNGTYKLYTDTNYTVRHLFLYDLIFSLEEQAECAAYILVDDRRTNICCRYCN